MSGVQAWGNQVQVLGSAGEPYFVNSSAVAARHDGGFVIASTDTNGALAIRFIEADGTSLSPRWNLDLSDAAGSTVVTVLSDGRVVAAWAAVSGGVSSIWHQMFNADGSPSGDPVETRDATATLTAAPSVTALEDGRFLLAWTDSGADDGDGDGAAVLGRIFRSDGSPEGAEFLINQTTAGNQARPVTLAMPDGGFVVAWNTGDNLSLRIFGSEAAPLASEIALASGGGAAFQDMQVLSDGRVGVAYRAEGDFRIAVLDEAGVLLETLVVGSMSSFSANTGPACAIEALPDGGLLVAWANAARDAVTVQRYTADLQPDGAALTYPAASLRTVELDTLADGRIVLTFNAASIAYTRILDARDGAVTLSGGVAGETLYGTAWNDRMDGNDGSDTLIAGAGSDRLNGGAGNDVLDGGDGNDTLNGGAGRDSFIGGAGIDTAAYGTAGRGVIASLDDPSVNTGEATGDTYSGIENLTGSRFIDTLIGDGGANVLNGGAGADILAGGNGDDTYYVDHAGDFVVEADGAGADRIFSSVGYALPDHVERLILTGAADIDGVGGGGADMIYGNSGSNALIGLDGNDRLDGGAGADELLGGLGDDIFYVDDAGDLVMELAAEGFDRVFATASHTLAENVERLDLTGSADLDGSGNDGANTLGGNAGANHLQGLAGADTLIGTDGDDILDGGADKDRLIGGSGDDAFIFVGSWGRDTIIDFQAGEGSEDVIQLDAAQFADFDAVLAAITYNSAGEVMINSGVSVIVLNGVMAGQLHADDFVFVAIEDARVAPPTLAAEPDWLMAG